METKWSVILKRCGILMVCLTVLLAEVLVYNHYFAARCAQSDLELQALLPVQVTQDEGVVQEKVVYLTFDDGPSPVTPAVLDVLKAEGVPATFFVMAADHNTKYLPTLERVVGEGHLVALHTCTHTYKDIYSSPQAYWDDLEALKLAIMPYGCGNSSILRFPGGSTNTVSRKYGGSGIMNTLKEQAAEKGYRYVDWNVCGNDSVGGKPSAANIYRDVIKDVGNQTSCVVLLHDSSANGNTAQALPEIILWFKNAGYRFDTVDNLQRQI